MRYLAIALLISSPACAVEVPDEVTKVEALKLGYILNGNSMVRWHAIDLVPPPITKQDRVIPLTTKPKKEK